MINCLFLSLRTKHWIKNALIFIPLIFAKKLFVWPDNLLTACAFGIFCLATSSAYLANDIADAQNDRCHPTKKNRPIATGTLTHEHGRWMANALALTALALAFSLNKTFFLIVALSLLLNRCYTHFLKKFVILDILCISALFLVRIYAGAAVAHVPVSHWIISMTVSLALLLGLNKRRQEFRILKDLAVLHRPVLAHYRPFFLDIAIVITTALIFIIYFLYAISIRAQMKFGNTHLLLTVPLVYCGIWRYLHLAYKQHGPEDPTDILFSDVVLQTVIAGWVISCILIIYAGT